MRLPLFPSVLILVLAASSATPAEPRSSRNVYWGEQHVHTSWSLDAFAFGNTVAGPEEFYQYALGRPTPNTSGTDVRITRPLDWAAVTEHSDYMGVMQQATDPGSPLRQNSPFIAQVVKYANEKDPLLAFKLLSATVAKGHPIEQLASPSVLAPVWRRLVDIADKYNEPGRFTTFAAYEWTSTPDAKNLHRNIFFLDSKKVPEVPFTPLDSSDPRDLWRWMDEQRAAGNELLAVSHNANLSDGRMFPVEADHTGRPLDGEWAAARLRNEPLTELKQGKGQSETTPGLSPNDEFAGYEVFTWQLLGAAGPPTERGSYVRQAYKDGLALEQAQGFNPYKFGVVAGSDSHVGAAPYRQENFFGLHGSVDDTIEERVDGATVLGLNSLWVTPAGLSAVWAEENTREAIFAGMKRKEAYSTTGVRIPVRFFGGWGFERSLLEGADWTSAAYAAGVPMGSDLPVQAGEAPSFAVWAMKDPDAGNLDRVQIIKGWSQNGQTFEQVHDVAWAGDRTLDARTGRIPPIGSTVDLRDATYTNTIGAAELKAVWTDPDFDPSIGAFYYVRVLEIPTPRWSTIQAVKLGRLPPSGSGFQPIIQERAWSSPIWYTPNDDARKAGKPVLTVAELERRGAKRLSEDQIKALVVGKTIHVRNNVTEQSFDILYDASGYRLITAVDGQPPALSQVAELMHGGGRRYRIQDGQLLTELDGVWLEIAIYRLGDRYVASRSDEFGRANYEVQPVSP